MRAPCPSSITATCTFSASRLLKTEERAAELEAQKRAINVERATLADENERLATAAEVSAAAAAAAAADAKHSKGAIQALLGSKVPSSNSSGSSTSNHSAGGAAADVKPAVVLPNSTARPRSRGGSGTARHAAMAAELEEAQKKMKQALLKNTKLESTVQMLRTQLLEYATDSEDEGAAPALTGDAKVDALMKQIAEAAAREKGYLEEIEKSKDWQRMYQKIVQSFFGADGEPLPGSPEP